MDEERTTTKERRTRRAERAEEARDENPGVGEQTGEGVGGIGGTLIGAGIGSAAGPIGTIVGGIAGAMGGWWVGEKAGRAAEDLGEDTDYYRSHWQTAETDGLAYDDAMVGYGVGHIAGHNPDYSGRTFETIEPELRNNWKHDRYDYDTLRPYVREGYARTADRRG